MTENRVQERRERLRISKSELAREAGVNRDTLTDLEAGKGRPHPTTVEKIDEALTKLEQESGLEALPAPRPIGDPKDNLVEVNILGPDGAVRAVVRGPVTEEFQDFAFQLLQRSNAARNGALDGGASTRSS